MYIDKYLETIQEDMGIAVGIGAAAIVANLTIVFLQSMVLAKTTKVDPKLSKRINNILKSPTKYVVHIMSNPSPNAFALGFGKHMFVTSSLLKLLNDKEIDSILLHEAYHNKSKHTYQDLAYKYTMWSICLGILTATGFAFVPGSILAVYILMHIMLNIAEIPYRITVGRRHEYNADSYAAQFGYGDYLISAFNKLEKYMEKLVRKQGSQCGAMCQVVNKIDRALDEHPSTKNRVENILKQSKKLKDASFKKVKDFVIKAWNN